MRKYLFLVYSIILISVCGITCAPKHTDRYPQCGKARIVTDRYGVPHIYATKETEAMYALGFCHARNRLKQIFSSKLMATGRISEILGPDYLEQDRTYRLFRLKERAERILAEMETEYKDIIHAYCKGVNDYLLVNREEIPTWIDQYEPEDLLALSMMINLYFPLNTLRNDINKKQMGSNQFAVMSNRSANGHAMLSMDPHLHFTGPFAWMEAQISTPDFSIVGCSIPGLPAIIMGHNGHVAWCNTNNNPDLADIYAFEIHSKDPSKYKGPDGWMAFETHEETFRFKTGKGIKERRETLMFTLVGPVLSIENRMAYAGRVSGYDSADLFKQTLLKSKAKTVREYLQSFRVQGMSMWNQMAADNEGNIGYLYNAILPVRDSSLDWSHPVKGDDPRSEWKGVVSLKELPMVINPPSGWLQNCNDAPWNVTSGHVIHKEDLPFRLVPYNDTTERGKRITGLLSGNDIVTLDDMMNYATDTEVPQARLWVPRLISAYETYRSSMSLEDPEIDESIQLFKEWDLRCDAESSCMALFYHWYRKGNLRHIVKDFQITEEIAQKQLLELGIGAAEVKRIYGRLDIPWGRILHLRHGDIEVPLSGGGGLFPIVKCAYGRMNRENRIPVIGGSSYLMVVEMSPIPKAYSCFPLGINEDQQSSHFADMTFLYSRMQYKPVYYSWEELEPNIESDEILEIDLEI